MALVTAGWRCEDRGRAEELVPSVLPEIANPDADRVAELSDDLPIELLGEVMIKRRRG